MSRSAVRKPKAYGRFTETKFRELSEFFETLESEGILAKYALPTLDEDDELTDSVIIQRRRGQMSQLRKEMTGLEEEKKPLSEKELEKHQQKISDFLSLPIEEFGSTLEQFVHGQISFPQLLEMSGFQVGKPDFQFTKAERRMIGLMLLRRRQDHLVEKVLSRKNLPKTLREMLRWDKDDVSAEVVRFYQDATTSDEVLQGFMDRVEGITDHVRALGGSEGQKDSFEGESEPKTGTEFDAEVEAYLKTQQIGPVDFASLSAEQQKLFEDLRASVADVASYTKDNPGTSQLMAELAAIHERMVDGQTDPAVIWKQLSALTVEDAVDDQKELELLEATEAYDIEDPEQLMTEFYPSSFPDESTWQRRRVIILHKIYTTKALLEELKRLDEAGTPYDLSSVRKMEESAEMEIRLQMGTIRKKFAHILKKAPTPELETELFFKHLMVLKELTSALQDSLAVRKEARKALDETPSPEEAVEELIKELGFVGEDAISPKEKKVLALEEGLLFLGFDLSDDVVEKLAESEATIEIVKSMRQSIHLDRESLVSKFLAQLQERGIPSWERLEWQLKHAVDSGDGPDEASDSESDSESEDEDYEDLDEDFEDDEESDSDDEEYEASDSEADSDSEEEKGRSKSAVSSTDSTKRSTTFDLPSFLERRGREDGGAPWRKGKNPLAAPDTEDILIKDFVSAQGRFLEAEADKILNRPDDPFEQLPFNARSLETVRREVDFSDINATVEAEKDFTRMVEEGGKRRNLEVPSHLMLEEDEGEDEAGDGEANAKRKGAKGGVVPVDPEQKVIFLCVRGSVRRK